MYPKITIALPKGRLAKQVVKALERVGYNMSIDFSSRLLMQTDNENQFSYLLVKPSDVITYVEEGICDIGFVGSDSILESSPDIYELLDMKIGKCKMVIAGMDKDVLNKKTSLKVASKYPKIANDYFKKENIKASVVKLNGSVELGPIVGLSDVIVDIYETGSTLKANNLVLVKELFDVSTKLIVNKASYRWKRNRIESIVTNLEQGDE